jgi:hypothetical protein
MVVLVMLTQRPRPSYLFSLGILMMALAGLAAFIVLSETNLYPVLARAYPALTLLAVLLVPAYYHDTTRTNPFPLSLYYRTLAPFQPLLQQPGAVLMSAGYPVELCNYLAPRGCAGVSYWTVRSEVSAGGDWQTAMKRRNINLFYADELVLTDLQRPTWLDGNLEAEGWRAIGYQNTTSRRWMLLQRTPAR